MHLLFTITNQSTQCTITFIDFSNSPIVDEVFNASRLEIASFMHQDFVITKQVLVSTTAEILELYPTPLGNEVRQLSSFYSNNPRWIVYFDGQPIAFVTSKQAGYDLLIRSAQVNVQPPLPQASSLPSPFPPAAHPFSTSPVSINLQLLPDDQSAEGRPSLFIVRSADITLISPMIRFSTLPPLHPALEELLSLLQNRMIQERQANKTSGKTKKKDPTPIVTVPNKFLEEKPVPAVPAVPAQIDLF